MTDKTQNPAARAAEEIQSYLVGALRRGFGLHHVANASIPGAIEEAMAEQDAAQRAAIRLLMRGCLHDSEWASETASTIIREAIDAETAPLREALEGIAAMRGMCLLGPDSKHNMGDDAPCCHELGSNVAYGQAAAVAEDALAKQ